MPSSCLYIYPSIIRRDMLEALIAGKNVLLSSVDPIRWLTSQALAVFLHPGDEVLGFFSLPGSHVM